MVRELTLQCLCLPHNRSNGVNEFGMTVYHPVFGSPERLSRHCGPCHPRTSYPAMSRHAEDRKGSTGSLRYVLRGIRRPEGSHPG